MGHGSAQVCHREDRTDGAAFLYSLISDCDFGRSGSDGKDYVVSSKSCGALTIGPEGYTCENSPRILASRSVTSADCISSLGCCCFTASSHVATLPLSDVQDRVQLLARLKELRESLPDETEA